MPLDLQRPLSVVRPWRALVLAVGCAGAAGCSIEGYAIDRLGDALAGSGQSFASDDDPELVREAAPFSLKLVEGLLAERPEHPGLLLAAASGFVQYAYAFVQQDADRLEERDLAAAEELRARARRLYSRARRYGLRGLEVAHPGFEAALRHDPRAAVARAEADDVAFLYWTAAAWGAEVALSKDRPEVVADQPVVEALIDRAFALDPRFGRGAIDTFLISYERARPGGAHEWRARARGHLEQAIAKSAGGLAAPFVAYAEEVAIQEQDRAEFEALLGAALAIDPDLAPESRLENLVMQRRARWLLARADDLFVE
jgi:predicted anti-sigma-YlaC factor YlaD